MKKKKLPTIVFLKREKSDEGDGDYWVTFDTGEDALAAAEDGEEIFKATLEPVGVVRKIIE